MTKFLLGLVTLALGSGVASAQYNFGTPYGSGGGNGVPGYPSTSPAAGFPGVFPNAATFMPNFYNRQTQPLSPYLNMLRGGSPAVNYFYGVRPGLPNGGAPLGQMNTQMMGQSQLRSGYFPVVQAGEPLNLPEAGRTVTLPPSGNGGAVYGNRFGTASGGYPGVGGNMGGGRSGAGNGFTGGGAPPAYNRSAPAKSK